MDEVITYHDNGSIKEKYYINNNNQKNGLYIRYWDNGNIHYKINYLNDELNGLYISYHFNGDIWYKTNYLNNKQNGIQTDYSNNKITNQKYHI